MRRPGTKIPGQALLPVRFRAKFENLLLPKKIHRQGTGDGERNLAGLVAVGVFRIVLEDECMACLVQLHKFSPYRWAGGRLPVFKVINLAFEERILFEKLD